MPLTHKIDSGNFRRRAIDSSRCCGQNALSCVHRALFISTEQGLRNTVDGSRAETHPMRPVILVLISLALGGLVRPYHTASAQAPAPSGTVITIAGNGVEGFSGDDGPALDASISGHYGSAIGRDGTLYFADNNNFRIRAVDPATGIITTVAGNGNNGDGFTPNDGPATEADLSGVVAIAVDRARNALYIGDFGQNWVSKVDLPTNLLSRYAGTGNLGIGFSGDGGPATSASLGIPYGVATDAAGNLYFSDVINFRIRRVDPAGIITTIAGNGDNVSAGDGGPATAASFGSLTPIVAADSAGNVFVVDEDASANHVIRRIDAITGIITTVAGGGVTTPGTGPATDMDLGAAFALAVDDAGTLFDDAGTLFVGSGNQVFKVDLGTGQLSPFAGAAESGFSGDGAPALDARFHTIFGLTVGPGGGLIVSDTQNARIRYIAPDSINLVGDSGQTEFYLPWVSALSNDLIVTNNPNLSVIDLPNLVTVGGDVSITDNGNATVALDSLGSVGGDITIESTGTGTFSLGNGEVAGSIDLNLNGYATVALDSLGSVGGDITIESTGTGTFALGDGEVAGSIDLNLNGYATVALDSLGSVGGNITIESTGTGTFALGDGEVAGSIDLTLDGYTQVDAATAGGETAVTMLNSAATMEVTLPDGAFSSANPVTFSVERLPAGGVETVGGEMVTQLETYAFDFAIPTLNSAATLNFEIDLEALAEPDRLSLLDLLHQSAELTIGVRGDAPEAELQLFDVCSGGGPVADACVVVQWLDETRMLLDPLGSIDPSILRFEALVGHFSIYSVVAVGLAGDYNLDGVVDAADYTVWRDTLGQSGTGLAADGNRNNEIDPGDYEVWKSHFGAVSPGIGAGSGAGGDSTGQAAVPEPATLVLLITGMLATLFRRGGAGFVSTGGLLVTTAHRTFRIASQ
jgi:sugar lactone lactonase YvrE